MTKKTVKKTITRTVDQEWVHCEVIADTKIDGVMQGGDLELEKTHATRLERGMRVKIDHGKDPIIRQVKIEEEIEVEVEEEEPLPEPEEEVRTFEDIEDVLIMDGAEF